MIDDLIPDDEREIEPDDEERRKSDPHEDLDYYWPGDQWPAA